MRFDSLHSLFVDQLRDLYDAEHQIVAAFPDMVRAASSTELKQAFEHHLEQSREHVLRLEAIFHQINEPSEGQTCEAMEGLLQEGQEMIEADGDWAVKDAGLIAAAQRVEHYEIAGYGTVRTYAKRLGYDEAVHLLQETLDEEGDGDKKLTSLAEGGLFAEGINKKAQKH